MLGVVIPTLNAAATLPATLDSLREAGGATGLLSDCVVVDGGSADDTIAIARAAGVRVSAAPRGRGTQLAAGGRLAKGSTLLFLHADTVLAPGWSKVVDGFLRRPGAVGRAGYFRYRLDSDASWAHELEGIVAWRCRSLSLPYGDQGLLISRALYDKVGGYKPIPIMEDVDIIRRIGRQRLALVEADATTSAARYADGYVLRGALNILCLGLYFAGVNPRLIAKLYG